MLAEAERVPPGMISVDGRAVAFNNTPLVPGPQLAAFFIDKTERSPTPEGVVQGTWRRRPRSSLAAAAGAIRSVSTAEFLVVRHRFQGDPRNSSFGTAESSARCRRRSCRRVAEALLPGADPRTSASGPAASSRARAAKARRRVEPAAWISRGPLRIRACRVVPSGSWRAGTPRIPVGSGGRLVLSGRGEPPDLDVNTNFRGAKCLIHLGRDGRGCVLHRQDRGHQRGRPADTIGRRDLFVRGESSPGPWAVSGTRQEGPAPRRGARGPLSQVPRITRLVG